MTLLLRSLNLELWQLRFLAMSAKNRRLRFYFQRRKSNKITLVKHQHFRTEQYLIKGTFGSLMRRKNNFLSSDYILKIFFGWIVIFLERLIEKREKEFFSRGLLLGRERTSELKWRSGHVGEWDLLRPREPDLKFIVPKNSVHDKINIY